MESEPHGHRGHPTPGEKDRAGFTRQRLGALVVALRDQGFDERDALVWVSSLAFEIARDRNGETWSSPRNALSTTTLLLEGRAAKHWSLDAIERAISEVSAAL